MPRELEEYLKRERASLDVESPDEYAVWERISGKMADREKKPVRSSLKIRWIHIRNIAAAAIVIFCLGYITKDMINTFERRKSVTLLSIDPGLGRREEQYRSMVSYRIREAGAMPASDEAVIKELYSELDRLDTIYRQSMTDLRIIGPDERVINTIFDTYEQKIRLLELIILEKNKIANHENNEKIIL